MVKHIYSYNKYLGIEGKCTQMKKCPKISTEMAQFLRINLLIINTNSCIFSAIIDAITSAPRYFFEQKQYLVEGMELKMTT